MTKVLGVDGALHDGCLNGRSVPHTDRILGLSGGADGVSECLFQPGIYEYVIGQMPRHDFHLASLIFAR